MTIKDLIKNKDYDYISWRVRLPLVYKNTPGYDAGEFFGCCKSEGGKLIPLDGDIYDEDEVVLTYEEWSDPEEGVYNGLTVVVDTEWM